MSLRIVHEIPLEKAYPEEGMRAMVKRAGLRAFECESECVDCGMHLAGVMACSKCSPERMCEPHEARKMRCGKCQE